MMPPMWMLAAAAVALGGLVTQIALTRRDRRRHAAPGVLVNGLHVRQTGDQGPSVVFEAGLAATSLNWTRVQEALAGDARTWSYDRAGLGWSRHSRGIRSIARMTDDLRALTRQLAVPRPFVLVGHSFGTFVVRVYARRFPEDVAALVLIDPVMPDEFADASWTTRVRLWRAAIFSHVAGVLASFGLARLGLWGLLRRGGGDAGPLLGLSATLRRVAGEVAKLPPESVRLLRTRWSEPRFFRELAASVLSLPACAAEVAGATVTAAVPVVILSGAHQTAERLRVHEALATRHVVVDGSAHWIHLDRPELVAWLVLETAMLAGRRGC
jgi:pimeloyl-ACP methyl ester carboxylesterase